jgi:Cytochrome c554 and c-prime
VQRGRLSLTSAALACAAVAGAFSGCEHGGDPARPDAPRAPAVAAEPGAAALDPATCAPCHQGHVTAWSGSMHAYASDDPVFLAMNARGQRETGGKLGSFCVSCHAPLAVAAARGGLVDPASLPKTLRGVTCFFCHTVDATLDLHDGALRLAGDGAFRGAIADPVASTAHTSAYSPLHDRTRPEAATTCGACHDVRMPNGADLETTYAEWTTTAFALPGPAAKTCGGCHMPGTQGVAASVPGAPVRTVHDHAMAALDVALAQFPEAAAQQKAVQLSLDSALSAKLCVNGPADVSVTLENARIGHAWPTGATHDRRAWVELRAFAAGALVWSRGAAPNDAPPDLALEPDAVLLGRTLFDADSRPVEFLWEAAATRGLVLPPRASFGPDGTQPHVAHYAPPADVDHVTMRVRVTPFAPDVLDALVASGDLDAQVRAHVPVFSLASTTLEWSSDRGYACLP